MTLSVLSKLGLIVAVVAELESLLFMALHSSRLHRNGERGDYNWNDRHVLEAALIVGGSLLTAILSGLLIWGILKKHVVLVATWLAAAFPISGYVIGRQIYNVIKWESHYMYAYMRILLFVGGETIVIYAIFQLFLEIRRERAAVVKYFEPTKQPQTTGKSAECV